MSGADKMSVDIEVNEDGETLLLKAARIVTSFQLKIRRSRFRVYILAGTSIPNAVKSVTMSPSEAFII